MKTYLLGIALSLLCLNSFGQSTNLPIHFFQTNDVTTIQYQLFDSGWFEIRNGPQEGGYSKLTLTPYGIFEIANVTAGAYIASQPSGEIIIVTSGAGLTIDTMWGAVPGVLTVDEDLHISSMPIPQPVTGVTTNITVTSTTPVTLCFTNGILKAVQ